MNTNNLTTESLKSFNNKIKIIEKLISNINEKNSINNLSSKLNKLYSKLDNILISKKGVDKNFKLKSKLETLKSNIKDINKKINSIIYLINQEPNEKSSEIQDKEYLLNSISEIINEIIDLDMGNKNLANQIKKLKLYNKILFFYVILEDFNNELKRNLIREFFDKYLYIFFGNLDELLKSANLTNKNINKEKLQTINNLLRNIKSSMKTLKNINGSIIINQSKEKLKNNILEKTINGKKEFFQNDFNKLKNKLKQNKLKQNN